VVGEGGRSRRDEKEARVGGFQQEGDQGRCEDLGPGDVDVPGFEPGGARGEAACRDFVVELGAWTLD
jgi:hypothetical protein